MSGADGETTIVFGGQPSTGVLRDGNPPAFPHLDGAPLQLRTDPGAVARLGVAVEGELQRRRAVFGGASDGTPRRYAAAALLVGTLETAPGTPGVGART